MIEDFTGKRFGRLVVISRAENNIYNQSCWNVQCDCGKTKIVKGCNIKFGTTTSCGCYRNEIRSKHGLSTTKIYAIWRAMLSRCNNPSNPTFKYYGKRGITVCDEWNNINNFIKDMGEPPKGLTLDRIDNNKGYSKNNCRWVTMKTQANNTRRNKSLIWENKTFASLAEFSKYVGISQIVLNGRIFRLGWSISKAITTPIRKYNKHL